MNSVSWFLYLANVVDNLGTPLGFFAFVSCAAIVISLVVLVIFVIGSSCGEKDMESGLPIVRRLSYRAWAAALVVLFIYAARPDKNTLYAIAASQVGEQVVKSEAVQGIANDATKALQQWIKRQITDDKK